VFHSRVGSWVEHLPGANGRAGAEHLLGTNALAYFEKTLLTAVKCFITLATGIEEEKPFQSLLTTPTTR
jgi:hypothetical protein